MKQNKRPIKQRAKTTNKKYKGNKNLRKELGKKIASVALAGTVLVGGGGLISKLVQNHAQAENSKDAIILADQINDYIEQLAEQKIIIGDGDIANAMVGASNRGESITVEEATESVTARANNNMQDRLAQIQNLRESIQTYAELCNKTNRTVEQEKMFLDACVAICEAKGTVIDEYESIIAKKVAEAKGIQSYSEEQRIKVTNERVADTSNGKYVDMPTITMPDGSQIKSQEMSKDLKEVIIEARSLLDIDASTQNKTVEQLPVGEILEIYSSAMNFESKYRITTAKDGKLNIEEEKEQQHEEEIDR